MKRFIGVYNYTVILTFLGLVSTVIGMTQAIHGHYKTAIFCLALSGMCDAFDGTIARKKKDRTEMEKDFGVQLDSLCDVVCFGIFPALICYLLGVRGILGIVLVCYYCVCAVTRLAYFNVLEEQKKDGTNQESGIYHGLPVTSIAVIFPLLFWLQPFMDNFAFFILLHIMLLVVGTLFILDFPMRKPSVQMVFVMIILVGVTMGLIFVYTRFKIPKINDDSNPIINEFIEEATE